MFWCVLISIASSQRAEMHDSPVRMAARNERQISEGEGKIALLFHSVKCVDWLMTNRWDFNSARVC